MRVSTDLFAKSHSGEVHCCGCAFRILSDPLHASALTQRPTWFRGLCFQGFSVPEVIILDSEFVQPGLAMLVEYPKTVAPRKTAPVQAEHKKGRKSCGLGLVSSHTVSEEDIHVASVKTKPKRNRSHARVPGRLHLRQLPRCATQPLTCAGCRLRLSCRRPG